MGKRANTVLDFYYLTIQLKDLVRSGWKQWNVQRERLESVAEHIFSTCMLAIAIDSEFDYKINIRKVILMLTVHELEEIIISDITPIDNVTAEEKLEKGHAAINEILLPLTKGKDYKELIIEFDAHESPESKFAYMCDKLDADLMSLYYDKDLTCTVANATPYLQQSDKVKNISQNGVYSMGECFYISETLNQRFDEVFTRILEIARDNYIMQRKYK